MSSPVFWTPQTFFYPLGNTPAVSLTRDLPPEQPADILLLGCGDPRHVLYTCYADVTPSLELRKIDVTCCDLEPAVLARNILLFTLIEANTPIDVIWDIFYHFKIDTQALDTLVSQSETLYGYSQDTEAWRQSPYGSFLAFLESRTLSEIRRYWRSYADFRNLSRSRTDELRRQHTELYENIRKGFTNNPNASRSAGLLWLEAIPPMNNLFLRYWKNGTTSRDFKQAVNFNPSFIYSSLGESFSPHGATFPVGDFHLTPAYVPIISDPTQPSSPSTKQSPVEISKQQFQAWCNAFKVYRDASAIVVRSYAGDALSFCRALDLSTLPVPQTPGIFNTHWRAARIHLEQDLFNTPNSFDVIDTSNLADHLGLHNILIAARPLLKNRPGSHSVLYTEELKNREELAIRPLPERLCASVPTLATLLGLAPIDYISGFTTYSNVHEALAEASSCLERLTWVAPASGDRYCHPSDTCVEFDALDLAHVMLGVYHRMLCGVDDAPALLSQPKLGSYRFRQSSLFHPESLAIMLQIIKRFIRLKNGTWDEMLEEFLATNNKISGRPLEKDKFQELCLQLHLHGVYTIPWLKPNWRTLLEGLKPSAMFKEWPTIPPVLCVVLKVPRERVLSILGKASPLSMISLQCFFGPEKSSRDGHSSIRCVWGSLLVNPETKVVTLREDNQGKAGTSDLIVSFWAPAHLVTYTTKTVNFGMIPTLDAIQMFSNELGASLEIFKARLDNKDHVKILKYQPSLESETKPAVRPIITRFPGPTPSNSRIEISAGVGRKDEHYAVMLFSARVEIDSSAEQAALLNGVNPVVEQVSPCSMRLIINNHEHTVSYPYPILGSGRRLRVARKSHYVEIIVPISSPGDSGGFSLGRTPVLHRGAYSPWNIHHANLDRMPLVNLEDSAKSSWLEHHVALHISDTERLMIMEKSKAEGSELKRLAAVKNSIESIINIFAGRWGQKKTSFELCESTAPGSVYAVLLIGGIRLDLASFTVIIETAIVPVSESRRAVISPLLAKLEQAPYRLPITDDEVNLWKGLLPASVERARTWKHTTNCEYDSAGQIPISLEAGGDTICSCGAGIGFDSGGWEKSGWKDILPFATRAAIPLLFSVSYLQSIKQTVNQIQQGILGEPLEEEEPARWKDTPVCWSCGGRGKPELLACSGCKTARYCSIDCQRKDWKHHKGDCKVMPLMVSHQD